MRLVHVAAAAAAALSLGGAAASAQADSISFLRGGDIWVAAPDGSKQTQLTHDGGYGYQSRADDGSFIAVHGRMLRRLSPTGVVTAEFSTPVSGAQTAPFTSYFKGPFKAEISPDGSKVAYDYWYQEYYTDPGCTPVGDPKCTDTRVSVGIGYSHADRLTAWDEPGFGRQSGWIDPSWIDNTTLLQSDKSVLPNVDAIIDHPGDGNQEITRWFEDTNAWHLRDGEVSRRGDAAVFVSTTPRDASDPRWGQQDDQITIYRMTGAAPALPEQCFSFRNEKAVLSSPTFSPDGAHVAYASDMIKVDEGDSDAKDIVVGDMPSQSGGCQAPAAGAHIVINDALQPDWSPADVPVIAQGAGAPPPASAPAPAPAPGTGKPSGAGADGLAVAVSTRRLRDALSAGLRLRFTAPGAGRLDVSAARGKRIVARGVRRAAGAGAAVAVAKCTRAGRRALLGARSVRLTVRYRFRPAGGGAATSGSVGVTLRR